MASNEERKGKYKTSFNVNWLTESHLYKMNPCHCPRCKKRLPQIKNKRSAINLVSDVKPKTGLRKKKQRANAEAHTKEKMVRKDVIVPILNPRKSIVSLGVKKTIKKEIEVPYFESYSLACQYYRSTPIKYIDDTLKKEKACLDLRHKHLTAVEFKSLFIMFVYDYKIEKLSLPDTNLKDHKVIEFLKVCLLENNYITDLDLSQNCFQSYNSVQQIAEIIEHSTIITKLNLESTKLRDSHALYLKDVLVSNKYITHLNMSHNSFAEYGGKMFADVIKENDSLKTLDISWNHLRPRDISLILSSLETNQTLTELNVSFNGLNDEASTVLGKSLAKNATLRNLNVANNRISNDGAKGIAAGLAKNKTLFALDISHNPITAFGIRYILAAMIHNGSLITLRMKGISPDSVCIKGINYLKRGRTNIQIDHGTLCAREYRPRTGDVYRVQGDLCERIRLYLIQERLRARDLFNIWDKNKTGNLCYNDLVVGLNEAGISATVFMVEELIKRLDIDKDGMLSPNEFCGVLHIHQQTSVYPLYGPTTKC